jgi:UDP-GlcNAc:undecaprenyl-phosphate GlcNAc-1-phosphate transferase
LGGYAVVLAVAALSTLLLTPLVRRLAIRIGAIVPPSPRGVHTRATPTLGGAAMFVGFLLAMAVASQIPQFSEMFDGSSEPAGLMLAAGVMFAVGALDDLRDVSPPAKIAGMVLAGSLLSLFGVSMLFFRVPFAGWDTIVLSPDLAPLVTVVVVVLFANAVNLIDGLDGLAAGIVLIAGTALFLYSDRLFKNGFLEGSNIAPLVAIIAVGVCAGFLPFNFNSAKIFMGDAGALFLGLLLATTTITIGGRADYQYTGATYFFFAPLVIPLVILGVPIVDTAFSFVRRVARRRSFSVADKDHLHHRLMRLGHGPRRTVVILWLWTALLSAIALVPAYTNRGNAWVPFAVLGLALLLYVFFFPGRKQAQQLVAEEEEAARAQPAAGAHPPDAGAAEAASAAASDTVVDLESRRRRTGT